MERIADAFAWPFRDPDWLPKVLVMGLILLIPVVGAMAALGWMLAALDRLRAGEERLPPANFRHLGRGFELFVVYLAYYVALLLVAALTYVPAVVILTSQSGDSPNGPLVALGVALLVLTFSFLTLATLAMTFAMPALVLTFDEGGIGAGLRVNRVVRRALRTPVNTLIGGLMLIAAGIVGQLGLIACLIGVAFTQVYALAMQAWIIRSYELGTAKVEET